MSTTTDANGNYTLSNLPAGSQQLSATASGFLKTSQTVNITPGGTTTANFVLITQTGTVSGRITNASTGAGLPGVNVSYSGGSALSNANGDYTLNAVPPGKYTVTATLTGWVTESASVERVFRRHGHGQHQACHRRKGRRQGNQQIRGRHLRRHRESDRRNCPHTASQ